MTAIPHRGTFPRHPKDLLQAVAAALNSDPFKQSFNARWGTKHTRAELRAWERDLIQLTKRIAKAVDDRAEARVKAWKQKQDRDRYERERVKP